MMRTPFRSSSLDGESVALSLEAAAARLGVPETQVREWITTFKWERRFNGTGHLLLEERDVNFLAMIKSLKAVDHSCASIVRLIDDGKLPEQAKAVVNGLHRRGEIETLKAELKALHPPTRRPFWKFWGRA